MDTLDYKSPDPRRRKAPRRRNQPVEVLIGAMLSLLLFTLVIAVLAWMAIRSLRL